GLKTVASSRWCAPPSGPELRLGWLCARSRREEDIHDGQLAVQLPVAACGRDRGPVLSERPWVARCATPEQSSQCLLLIGVGSGDTSALARIIGSRTGTSRRRLVDGLDLQGGQGTIEHPHLVDRAREAQGAAPAIRANVEVRIIHALIVNWDCSRRSRTHLYA